MHRMAGAPLDIAATDRLVFETYRYAGLLDRGAAGLETTASSVAASLSLPAAELVYAYQSRGDVAAARRAADRAVRLSPSPDLITALRAVVSEPPSALDSSVP